MIEQIKVNQLHILKKCFIGKQYSLVWMKHPEICKIVGKIVASRINYRNMHISVSATTLDMLHSLICCSKIVNVVLILHINIEKITVEVISLLKVKPGAYLRLPTG